VAAVTDAERDQVRQLHARGLGRNAIATELGRSAGTITTIAKQLGLSFDRATTRAATEAKVADAKARRAALALNLLGDAERLREQLWQPHEYIDHGGKDFVRVTWTQPEPTPTDKLRLVQAATMAAEKSMRLEQHDNDGGADAARSMLGQLAAGLQAAYDAMTEDGPGASG
jgi:hypothetical protein